MQQERKDHLKELMQKLSIVPKAERMLIASKLGIVNPEGHTLSPRNQCLLLFQKPSINFSVVGGYKQWLSYGRKVKEGQKGSLISVPSVKLKPSEDESEEESEIFFLWRYFFDISQTN